MERRPKDRALHRKWIHRIAAHATTNVCPATALSIHADVVIVWTALVPAHGSIWTAPSPHRPARNARLPSVATLFPGACLLVLTAALTVVGQARFLPEAAAGRVERKAASATRLGATGTGEFAGGDGGGRCGGGSGRASDAADAEGPPTGAGDASDFSRDHADHGERFAAITGAGVVGERVVAGVLSAVEGTWDEGTGHGGPGRRGKGIARVNGIEKPWTDRTGVYQANRFKSGEIQKGSMQLREGAVEGRWGLQDWRRAAVGKDEAIVRHLQGRGGDRSKVSAVDLAGDLAVLLGGEGGKVRAFNERAPRDGATRCFVGLV